MQRRFDLVDRDAPHPPSYKPGRAKPEPDPDAVEQMAAHVTVFASKQVRDVLYQAWVKELDSFDLCLMPELIPFQRPVNRRVVGSSPTRGVSGLLGMRKRL